MHLEGLRVLGYPEFFAEKYYNEDIDEIIFQDVVASLYKRNQLSSFIKKISKNIFVPITVGGGLRSISDINEILVNGGDRVSINTAAINDKKFLKEAIKKYGKSTITVNVEVLKIDGKYKVYTESGRTSTGLDAFEWISELHDIGVGEIILTSINNEGTGKGLDLKLYEKITNLNSISFLAHGGTKNPQDVLELFKKTSVDGVIISSGFHFNYAQELLNKKRLDKFGGSSYLLKGEKKKLSFGIREIKEYLDREGVNIR